MPKILVINILTLEKYFHNNTKPMHKNSHNIRNNTRDEEWKKMT